VASQLFGAIAVVLVARLAGFALAAAVDHAADADQVAHLVLAHAGPDLGDAADDLVPRHAGVDGVRPFVLAWWMSEWHTPQYSTSISTSWRLGLLALEFDSFLQAAERLLDG
jgi:hypothetical protein